MELLILKLKIKMAELNEFGRQFLAFLGHVPFFQCLLIQLLFGILNLYTTSLN